MTINPPLAVPNTFVNGQIIDAGQVNANFAQDTNFLNTNGRFAITDNITFSVAPGGTDAGNTGLNPAAPCATISYVYSLLMTQYTWANPNAIVTIQLAPGVYNEEAAFFGDIPAQPDHRNLTINGNILNPAGTTINGGFAAKHEAQAFVQGVTVTAPTLDCFYAEAGGFLGFGNVIFGNAARGHIFAQAGGIVFAEANYTVSGNMQWHAAAQGAGAGVYFASQALQLAQGPIVVTLTGTPTFTYWHVGNASGTITSFNNLSFVNLAAGVGQKYFMDTNATNTTFTNGALVLPGNTAGIMIRGGQYY